MKTKIIQIPIYHHTLQVLFGDSQELKDTLIKEYKLDECEVCSMTDNISRYSGSMWYVEKTGDFYLWCENVPNTISDYGTLVHELQHFVFIFLGNKGLNHTEDSDEAYSYLMEYMYVEIDKWICELKNE